MSKLRIRQMIGGQVPTSIQTFEIPLRYLRNAYGSGSLLLVDYCSTPKGNALKKTQTLREEILKKTAKIGSPDPELYKTHKPALRLSIISQNLKKNLPILNEDFKSLSPKNYNAAKDSLFAKSSQDLLNRRKSVKNPLLSKTPRTTYKTRTGVLEKTKKSLLSKFNS